MSDTVTLAVCEKTPWYRWERFPLLPRFWFRPEDNHNRLDWGFSWLVLHVWTGISVSLGVRVELDDRAFTVQVHLPYLYVRFEVPLFPSAIYQKLWRVKPYQKRS